MNAPERFTKGRVYVRRELHDTFGGQRQGGISTPRNQPLIFIFTGSGGAAYGYADSRDQDGVFHYFGEGRVGHMEFRGGPRAIRDHARNEKELHLFEQAGRGRVRYVEEMLCTGFKPKQAPDRDGSMRSAIVFQLLPITGMEVDGSDEKQDDLSLSELAAAADADPAEESEPKDGVRKTYARSLALKRYVRTRAAGKCEGCGRNAPFLTTGGSPYLEAHHTLKRSDSGPGDRASVIALCPNCHSRVHYGDDGAAYNQALRDKLTQIETTSSSS